MAFQNIPPADPLVIPNDAVVGEPRIVIGTKLPPPLDTYIYNSGPALITFASAIIFYWGTPSDDDYAFLALPGVGATTLGLVTGAVVNGSVIERADNVPAGLNLEWMRTGALEEAFFANFNLAQQFGGVRIGTGVNGGVSNLDDSYVVPTNSAGIYAHTARNFRNIAGPNPQQSYGGATFDPIPTMLNVGIIKQYNNALTDIEMTLAGSLAMSAVPTTMEFGLRYLATATDYPIGKMGFNQFGHHSFTLIGRLEGFNAGDYNGAFGSFIPVWRRVSGTGLAVINQDDTFCYGLEEKGTIL